MRALVFDFDGVIADSEVLANTVLAELVTELGVPTTVEDSYRQYMGRRFSEVIEAIEAAIQRPVPDDFPAQYQKQTLDRFRRELTAVAGARTFIDRFSHILRCIASSSSPDRLALCLDVLGMTHLFEDRVFSAAVVERGKPYPDIFIHAASKMGFAASDCIVIEDSPTGVMAGRAAGATVVGLLAASHVQPDLGDRLVSAGAEHIARDFTEAEHIVRQILSMSSQLAG